MTVEKKIASAKEINLQQHVIEFMEQLMNGYQYSERRIPRKDRQTYEKQKEIGWKNFRKGRVHKGWAGVRWRKKDKDLDPLHIWMRKLVWLALLWYYEKWRIRCDLTTEERSTVEHARALTECLELWDRRG